MFQATNSRMPASAASGTCTRQRRGQQHHRQQRQRVHDAGDRRRGAGAHVGHRAGDRAGGRDAAEEGRHEVGHALRHQFLVGVVARQLGQVVGDARAQQRLDGAEQRDGDGRDDQQLGRLPAELAAGSKAGSACGMPPKREPMVSTGRFEQQPRAAVSVDQRDDRARQARARRAACALEQPRRAAAAWRTDLRPDEQPAPGRPARWPARRVDASSMCAQHAAICAKKSRRHLGDVQAQQVLHLRQRDQHRDAVGEADDDRHRHVAHQRAELEQPQQRTAARRPSDGGDQQVGQAVAFDDAVDDDDEGAGRPADLHLRAAQRADQEAGDDGGEEALLRA